MTSDSDIVAVMRKHLAQREDASPANALAHNITQAGVSLRFATLALRSCYSVNASSIADFVQLREDTTNKANIYKMKVLPLAKASLQAVKDWVIYFSDLKYEDCCECAEEILKDAKANKDLMILNRDTHKAMAVEFRQLEDQVAKVLKTCELEYNKFKKEADQLTAEGETTRRRAMWLRLIPVIGPTIVKPLMDANADQSFSAATVARGEAELAVAAAKVVEETLAGALNDYVFAMDTCAGEFEKLSSECETLADQTGKFKENKKEAFYLLMRSRADKILESVSTFQMISVAAEADLECLPKAPGPNYVQEWLAKKRDGQPTFQERIMACKESIMEKLMEAITDTGNYPC